MRKFLLVLVALFVASATQFTANAVSKEKNKSIYLGVSPFVGSFKSKLGMDGEKYIYKYTNYMNYSLGFERQWQKGTTALFELNYTGAKYDDMTNKNNTVSEYFNSNAQKDLMNIAYMMYYGYTINKGKRFQMPIYMGLGLDYTNGAGCVHNLGIGYGMKLRMKFYFCQNFGMFIGGQLRGDWGAKKGSMSGDSKSGYTMFNPNMYADLGLMFSF